MRELSPNTLYTARKKALQNALSLYEDACLLFENNRWPRSFFLCQIATEELGKYGVIATSSMWAVHGSLDWNHFRKRFTNHRDKTMHLLLFENLYLEKPSEVVFEDYIIKRDLDKREANLQEEAKLGSLYCDIHENGAVTIPEDLITKEICEMSLTLLRNRINLVSAFENEIACKIDINKLRKEDVTKILEEISFNNEKQS